MHMHEIICDIVVAGDRICKEGRSKQWQEDHFNEILHVQFEIEIAKINPQQFHSIYPIFWLSDT